MMNEKASMKKISDKKMDLMLSEFFTCLPDMPDRSEQIMGTIHRKSLQPDAGFQPVLWVLIISFAAVASYFKDWIMGSIAGEGMLVIFLKLSAMLASFGISLNNWIGLLSDRLFTGASLVTVAASVIMMVVLFTVL